MKESKNTKKVKVTCKVSLVAAKNAKLRWRHVRAHRTYANGTARARHGRAFIRLPNLRTLHRSRYVLRIAGRRSGTVIVVLVSQARPSGGRVPLSRDDPGHVQPLRRFRFEAEASRFKAGAGAVPRSPAGSAGSSSVSLGAPSTAAEVAAAA